MQQAIEASLTPRVAPSAAEELRRFCSRGRIDYQTIRTSEHIDAVLAHYLNHRIGMQQSGRQ